MICQSNLSSCRSYCRSSSLKQAKAHSADRIFIQMKILSREISRSRAHTGISLPETTDIIALTGALTSLYVLRGLPSLFLIVTFKNLFFFSFFLSPLNLPGACAALSARVLSVKARLGPYQTVQFSSVNSSTRTQYLTSPSPCPCFSPLFSSSPPLFFISSLYSSSQLILLLLVET